jgi:membrane protease YdiL (CAAX protease family)
MNTLSGQSKRSLITAGVIGVSILLFIIAFGSPFLFSAFGYNKLSATTLFISRLFYWVCLLLIWLYAVKIEHQNLLIWKDKKYTFWMAAVSVIAILLIIIIGMIPVQILLRLTGANGKSNKIIEMTSILRSNHLLLVFTALTASVVEEFIFRGYLQTRLEIIFKKPYIAIILSSLIFAFAHFTYGTIINVVGPLFIGIIFSCYYSRFRNIKILIICHLLWDLATLFLLINAK